MGVCGIICVSVNVCCDIGRDRVCVYWHAPRQIMFVHRFAKMLSYKHASTILNTFKTCMKYTCMHNLSIKQSSWKRALDRLQVYNLLLCMSIVPDLQCVALDLYIRAYASHLMFSRIIL